MAEPRRTFGPVLLLGAAAGTLAAVAGNKPWVVDASGDTRLDPLGLVAEAGEMPLAAALSLVVLACWGVVLVTRRRVRRAVAALGLLAALGLAATVVVGWMTLDDQVLELLRAQPTRASTQGATGGDAEVATTGWFWAAAVGAVLSVVATAAAVRLVPHWPEMGDRYDAPVAGEGAAGVPSDDASNLDLWKAMDEGHDPTA
jgi:uncharacterized membrane protein (TIGR02234 family)